MDENKKFELNDDELDGVAGGAALPSLDQSIEYNGVVFRTGDRLRLTVGPCNNCGRSSYGIARHFTDFCGSPHVCVLMECCQEFCTVDLRYFEKA